MPFMLSLKAKQFLESECELILHKSFSNVTAYKKEHYPLCDGDALNGGKD
jgi:hypothetical protein